MRIEVTHDDGTTQDVTGLVRAAYDALWQSTRWDKDWDARDVEQFAALARACRYDSADVATEVAAEVRAADDEERERVVAWNRDRAEQVVAALADLD